MPNTSTPTPPSGVTPQPPSLEKRLPIALGLMMVVLLVSQYFFKPAPGPKPVQTVTPKVAVKEAAQPSATTSPAPSTPAAGREQAAGVIETQIDTQLYHIVLLNRGAAVESWVLKKYKDDSGKSLELINKTAVQQKVPLPFTIDLGDRKLNFDPNSVLYRPTVSADGRSVEYVYSDGTTTIRKSFRFGADTYLADVKSSITQGGTPIPHFLMWRGGFGDAKVFRASITERTVRYDGSASKLVTKTAKDASKGPVTD
ncbi:MAG: membrane protein insertase YidC, partial [Acidobacteriaceae bacterium]|nr:membrane protein insertase YidC [Acidobacteriaceae bacterium]